MKGNEFEEPIVYSFEYIISKIDQPKSYTRSFVVVEKYNELKNQYRVDKAKHEETVKRLQEKLNGELSDCLQLIDERDLRESQINDIANLLGDKREWSNMNDRGENCIESIGMLQKEIATLKEVNKSLVEALEILADEGDPMAKETLARAKKKVKND